MKEVGEMVMEVVENLVEVTTEERMEVDDSEEATETEMVEAMAGAKMEEVVMVVVEDYKVAGHVEVTMDVEVMAEDYKVAK